MADYPLKSTGFPVLISDALPREQTKTGNAPAHRQPVDRVGIDPLLDAGEELDGAAAPVDPQPGLDAAAVLRASLRLAAVHAVHLDRAVHERAEARIDVAADRDVRVGSPLVVDERMLDDR